MNNVGRISPIHSDSEDSSDDNEFNLETQALIQQAVGMQEILQGRIQQVQDRNIADIAALENMDYLRGVNFTFQNLTERSREMNQVQQNLSNTLQKGESVIVAKQKDLNTLQAQIADLKKKLNHTPSNPLHDFSIKLGGRVCEYISNPKSCEKYYGSQSKRPYT